MKSYTLFLALLLCVVSSLVAESSDVQVDGSSRRKTYAEDPNESVATKHHPPPKKPASTTGSTQSSLDASSASSGGSAGTGSSGGSAGTSGSGGSSGTMASSGSSTSGTASTSGTGTGQTNTVAGATAAGAHSALESVGADPRKGTLMLLGVAAVAGVAIAAATVPKRRVETSDHPLKGALNRRINLFSHLAKHPNGPGARPPRLVEDGAYVNADEVIV